MFSQPETLAYLKATFTFYYSVGRPCTIRPTINGRKGKLTQVLQGGGWAIYTYILFLRLLFFNEKVVNEVARPVVCRVSYATGVSASFTQFFF